MCSTFFFVKFYHYQLLLWTMYSSDEGDNLGNLVMLNRLGINYYYGFCLREQDHESVFFLFFFCDRYVSFHTRASVMSGEGNSCNNCS